jgi:hypothetical protein
MSVLVFVTKKGVYMMKKDVFVFAFGTVLCLTVYLYAWCGGTCDDITEEDTYASCGGFWSSTKIKLIDYHQDENCSGPYNVESGCTGDADNGPKCTYVGKYSSSGATGWKVECSIPTELVQWFAGGDPGVQPADPNGYSGCTWTWIDTDKCSLITLIPGEDSTVQRSECTYPET